LEMFWQGLPPQMMSTGGGFMIDLPHVLEAVNPRPVTRENSTGVRVDLGLPPWRVPERL